MEKEFKIPSEDLGEEVNYMCNLGDGIYEQGTEKGRIEGRIEGKIEGISDMILSMYKNGLSLQMIATISEKTVTEVEEIIKARGMK